MRYSITIPAYKVKYLRKAIESVLSQTYTDFELIIVNDASPDDIDSVVSLFDDKRIKYYKNEKNCGAVDVVDNWTKCLGYAIGDYLICMGDDDELCSNCLEEYNAIIEKYPHLGVYHARTEIIDENSCFYQVTSARPEYESALSLIWHRWEGREQFIGDFLFDTKLLKRNGGFYKLPYAWASDDISVVLAAKDKGIANTQKVTFRYRVNPHTISISGNARIKMESVLKEQDWYQQFLVQEPVGEDDYKFWISLRRRFDRHFDKKKGLTIASDLKHRSLFSILYWLKYRKYYKVSYKVLVFSMIQALK